jgi:hypothetical protein
LAKQPRSVCAAPHFLRRCFSDDDRPTLDVTDASAPEPEPEDNRWPYVAAPEGYCVHTPPPCAAWDLTCSTWKSIDRDSGLIR